ncbi:eukaryotic translation initiation factor 2-alpha kinase [Hypoxylon texense]
MKSTFASLLLAAFLPALPPIISAQPSPDYSGDPISASCIVLTLHDNHSLHAFCLAPDGTLDDPSWRDTTLDLDACLANRDGDLGWSGGQGSFSGSCASCRLEQSSPETMLTGTVLTCECGVGGDQGGTKTTKWDLDDWKYIRNSQGALTCSYDG